MQNNTIVCPIHLENQATYICQNESCIEKRLYCHTCFQSNKHFINPNKHLVIDRLSDILEESRNDCDRLVQYIETAFQDIIQFKKYLVQAIRRKYYIQLEQFNTIDLESKCQILDNLIKFKEDSKIIEQVLDYPFKSIIYHIQDGIKQVRLEQVTYLQQISEQELQQFQTYLNESQELIQFNRIDQSLEKVDRALLINPRNLDALNLKGNILMKLHRLNEAFQQFNLALQIDEFHIKSMLSLGFYYIQTNQREKAMQQFIRVAEIDIGNQIALDQVNQL
ncbi:unnamed protein product [Paramecium pentaurelia]|uniref:Tetratricopeptide repeat protein n=1 Tax=Paramecium pentaurelia TaxID=43138 RepID=A0A8S1VR30_9CILI|nr:unnamed protein product [Paramecium pentaurelia]